MDLLTPVLAGAAAALVAAVALRRADVRWRAALSLGVAFLAARLAAKLPAAFPPTYVENWALYLAPVFVAIALLEAYGRMAAAAVWATRAVASSGLAWLFLAPNVDFDGAPLAIAANGAAVFVVWTLLATLARRGPRILLLGAYGVPLAAVAVSIGVSYMASVGQVAGGFALGGALALWITWRGRAEDVARATVPIFVLGFGSLLLTGGYYTDGFPRPALALLAASPLVAWVGRLPPLASLPERARVAIGAVATVGVCALAVWLGWPEPAATDGW